MEHEGKGTDEEKGDSAAQAGEESYYEKEVAKVSKYPFNLGQHLVLIPVLVIMIFLIFEAIAIVVQPEGHGFDSEWAFYFIRDMTAIIIITVIALMMFNQQRRNLEKRFKDLYDQIRESELVKASFLSNISHELRTPLTIINGYVKYLLNKKAGQLTQDQEKFLRIASEEADRLQQLIDELLLISTLEKRGLVLDKDDLELGDVLRAIVEKMDVKAKARKVKLMKVIPEGRVWMKGDRHRLTQVFTNLIDNAIKFTPDDGIIEVRLREREKHVVVDIIDTGIGIPKDKLEKVFDRFFQVDGSTSRMYRGAGLGLSICRDIVNASGGEISVESPVSKSTLRHMGLSEERMEEVGGTMFRVRLER